MKTRRELIVEQAMALQVAIVAKRPILEAIPASEAALRWRYSAAGAVMEATALADALGLVDEPRDTPLTSDTIEDYRVPRAVGDAWIRDRDFVGVGTWHRPLYDCLKAQQQEQP